MNKQASLSTFLPHSLPNKWHDQGQSNSVVQGGLRTQGNGSQTFPEASELLGTLSKEPGGRREIPHHAGKPPPQRPNSSQHLINSADSKLSVSEKTIIW